MHCWHVFVQNDDNFSKALNRFQREDPTFRVMYDPESREVHFAYRFISKGWLDGFFCFLRL